MGFSTLENWGNCATILTLFTAGCGAMPFTGFRVGPGRALFLAFRPRLFNPLFPKSVRKDEVDLLRENLALKMVIKDGLTHKYHSRNRSTQTRTQDSSYWAAARRALIIFDWVGHGRNRAKQCSHSPFSISDYFCISSERCSQDSVTPARG